MNNSNISCICCICITFIAVVALILFSFLCPTDGANGANNEKNEEICMAQSVAATVESASQVKVIVPPNSAISKIYTSIVQFDFEEINGGGITVTQIGGEDIFLYDFHKDPEDTFGNHETTFPQPLCVGSTGAEVGFISLDGDVGRNADNLRLTVVYCPNFCAP